MRKRIYDYDFFADVGVQTEEITSVDSCACVGCEEDGEYPAPVSGGDGLHYAYFCLAHVREQNKNWNYFKDMSATQARAFQKEAEYGHRPTRHMHSNSYHYFSQLQGQLDDLMGKPHVSAPVSDCEVLSAKEKAAIDVLGLSYPVTLEAIKQRYKELVKRYHPDVNQGDSACEAMFRDIVEAYGVLASVEEKG